MSKNKDDDQISRLMSYILRHAPETHGIQLDVQGWVEIDLLAKAMGVSGMTLVHIAAKDEKQRYEVKKAPHFGPIEIRAAQGHSTKQVNLDFEEVEPPETLLHGTRRHVLDSIFKDGLTPQSRHLVHMSEDEATAFNVANRRKGSWAILSIKAAEMHNAGYTFYRSSNGVWLCKHVPPQFLGPVTYDTASNWTDRNGYGSGAVKSDSSEDDTTNDPLG